MIKPLILFLAIIIFFSAGCFVGLIMRYPKMKKHQTVHKKKSVSDYETEDSSPDSTQQETKSPLSKIDKSCSYTEFSSELDGNDKSSIIRKNMKTQDKKYHKTKGM